MKKIITLALCTLVANLDTLAWTYSGPRDERMPPGYNSYGATLGRHAKFMDMAAVADVIAETWAEPPEILELWEGHFLPNEREVIGTLTVRVVDAIYGCTNGQEIVLVKPNPKTPGFYDRDFDPNFEYYPTNNSRIVVVGDIHVTPDRLLNSRFAPRYWELPATPEVIVSPADNLYLAGFTRQWWHEGYQDNLPYTHLTNLLHVTRKERNWTNYYHAVRDGVPSPSNRVWEDSFGDLEVLYREATPEQFRFMYNDPLLNNEIKLNMKEWDDGKTTPVLP